MDITKYIVIYNSLIFALFALYNVIFVYNMNTWFWWFHLCCLIFQSSVFFIFIQIDELYVKKL